MASDELIKLHKSAVDTSADADAALSRATKESNEAFNQFVVAKQMLQDQLVHDLEALSTKTQSFFEKLVKGVDAAVHSTLSKFGLMVRAMESDAASLSEVSQSGRNRWTPKRSQRLTDLR